jgi:hypothetical protein
MLWDASRGQSGAGRLLVDYTSGQRGAAYAPPTAYSTTGDFPRLQQDARDCLQQLERVFPGISAHYTGKVALSYPTGDPFLLGSYACWRVGQYTHFGGYEGAARGRFTSRANIARSSSRVIWKERPGRARGRLLRLCGRWPAGEREHEISSEQLRWKPKSCTETKHLRRSYRPGLRSASFHTNLFNRFKLPIRVNSPAFSSTLASLSTMPVLASY